MSEQKSFEQIAVSELFCGKCKSSQRVRRILLFELPIKEYDYRCIKCDNVVGSMTDDSGEFNEPSA
jgi:hypothetical protein